MDGMRRGLMSEQARAVALRAGALEPCPVHVDVVVDACDPPAVEEALEMGRSLADNGEVEAREEFLTMIESVVTRAGVECPFCVHNSDD